MGHRIEYNIVPLSTELPQRPEWRDGSKEEATEDEKDKDWGWGEEKQEDEEKKEEEENTERRGGKEET